MKKQLLHIAATLSLFLMLGIVASAQTTLEMTVNIPFDFYAGKTQLPAGTYTVYRTSNTSGDGFMLRSSDNKTSVVLNAKLIQTSNPSLESRFEFRRYNDKYFLARVWTAGNKNGRELQMARLEREVARDASRNLAKGEYKTEIITVPNQ